MPQKAGMKLTDSCLTDVSGLKLNGGDVNGVLSLSLLRFRFAR